MELVDRDRAIDTEHAHPGRGSEPHEKDGPAELRGKPAAEDLEENGKKEGRGHNAAAK